jgi:hypothetical protein
VTLVTRDDSRLVSDIEKLIKKKIDLEPFELEDERPRRPPRRNAEEEGREYGAASGRVPPAPRAPAPAKSRDPFFDRPYEASASPSAAPASWESTAPAPAPVGRASLSANIRAKRKVAALLGGGPKA